MSDEDAPTAYLTPHGWHTIDKQLQANDFAEYQQIVAREVVSQRVPVVANRALIEAQMASPIELPPSNSCNGKQRGIALLVHGLSDTAYAMRDVATVLANKCFRARTVLLPGHGTRPGDLLNVQLSHWTRTLDYLIEQAATEDDHILLAGFSLGATLTLNAALKPDTPVNALIAISPAYSLSSWRLARWAPWFHRLKPWVDREFADDSMRYEAMPTRGVAETVKAMKIMQKSVARQGAVPLPWLMIQSTDDAVTIPSKNRAFFSDYASNPISQVIEFNGPKTITSSDSMSNLRIIRFPGYDESMRVLGLTHTSVHISPDNPHYGIQGTYRNCGGTARRPQDQVARCVSAEKVWYGLWKQEVKYNRAQAMSTFNPNFNLLDAAIGQFVDDAIP